MLAAYKHISTLLFFFSILITANAQVVINEFSAANWSDITDNYGNNEDWIELYNTTSTTIDLSNYYLSDKISNPTKWAFPAGTTIAANDHLLIWASGRDEQSGGQLHTNFKITQTKTNEDLLFSDPSGTLLDVHTIDIPNKSNHSRGRITDGDSTWGVFTNTTPNASNTNAKQEYLNRPIFDLAPGLYSGTITLGLSSPDPTATIYYTINGNLPSATSTLYTAPISLNQTRVVRAIAISSDPNIPDSFIEANTYFIDDVHSLPVISISGGNYLYDLLDGDWGAEPLGHLEFFSDSQQLIDEAYGEFNKHGNDSWAYDQRGIDYITRDQLGYNYAIQHQIFPIKERNEYQKVILKAAANDNYPFEDGSHIRHPYVHTLSQLADMKLDERTYEPCILYLNGEYWGLYEVREKVDDHDFTSYYYDQDEEWVDFIKTWGATWAEYGGNAALNSWSDTYDYIVSNDMSNPANYDYVKSEFNVGSLVDYMIINTHVVCMDWLNWNTAWWRGRNPDGDKKKWRYTLWDMDASFGHYINYTGIPDTSPTANPCDNESPSIDDPEGHTEMLSALLENEEFYALYINRYADLNNTYFSCDYMTTLLDDMIGRIAPEMPRQINRWGGTMAGWQNAVDELRDFILNRCVNLDDGMLDCYEIDGPYPLILDVNVPNGGSININTIDMDSFPWTGDYFSGVNLTFETDPTDGYIFAYWEVTYADGSITTFNTEILQIEITDALSVTAYFAPDISQIVVLVEPPTAGDVSIDGIIPSSYPWTSPDLNAGMLLNLTATANNGYTFASWETNNSTIDPDNTTPTVNYTVAGVDTIIAHFNATIIIIAEPADAGTVNLNGLEINTFPYDAGSFANGTPIVLTATALSDYTFTHWELVNNTLSPDEFTSTVTFLSQGPDTIIAHFSTPEVNLTLVTEMGGSVNLNGNDINSSPWSNTYTLGSTIELIATPDEGYEFAYWTVNNNTIAPNDSSAIANLTLLSTDTLTAYFSTVNYTITIVLNDPSQGSISIDGITISDYPHTFTVNYGETLNLNAIAAEGYEFSGWDASNIISGSSSDANISIEILSDGTVMVSFTEIEQAPLPDPECKVLIPTAFSPNNDGTNDEFKPLYNNCSIENYELKLFNRWGQQVYTSTNSNESWDGKYQGDRVEMGVYIYLLSYTLLDGSTSTPKYEQGNITVIK